ncbi:MAG: hypothetical protein CSA97_01280 [Bacteroidetes bacterium]|nr:MAG: hypothetical protein CSA97_01280 [Bacteroidota bacterium]
MGSVSEKIRLRYQEKLPSELYGLLRFTESRTAFFRYALDHRGARFILHGLHFTWMAPVLFTRADWINWGSGVKTNWRNPLSILGYPLKYVFYHSLSSVNALIEEDIVDLKRSFRLRDVGYLRYILGGDYDGYRKRLVSHSTHSPLRVLVGNSAHCIDTYYEVADLLGRRSEAFTVHFMLQYPRQDEEVLARFASYLDAHLNHPYQLDLEVMELDAYHAYIDSFDIYICGSMGQSGLGAIGDALLSGVVAVLRGKNLAYKRSQGFRVYGFEDLNRAATLQDLLLPKSVFETHIQLALRDEDVERAKWISFFEEV